MVKPHILRCLLTIAVALPASPQAAPPSAPPSAPAEAQKLLDAGRLEEALKLLDPLAKQQPEPPGVDRLRGMSPMWKEFEEGVIDSVIAPTGRGKSVTEHAAALSGKPAH